MATVVFEDLFSGSQEGYVPGAGSHQTFDSVQFKSPIVNPTNSGLGTTGTVSLDPTRGSVFTVTPTGSMTINAASCQAGQHLYLVVTTSGTSSFTLTFSSKFKTTGTLATGTVSGKVFTVHFVGDGTNYNELARTTAM